MTSTPDRTLREAAEALDPPYGPMTPQDEANVRALVAHVLGACDVPTTTAKREEGAVSDDKCITVCRECSDANDPLVMPFGTKAERDEWEAAHGRANGHTFFRLNGWPRPAEVKLAMTYQDKVLGRPSEGHR